jgi:hypothetical protein
VPAVVSVLVLWFVFRRWTSSNPDPGRGSSHDAAVTFVSFLASNYVTQRAFVFRPGLPAAAFVKLVYGSVRDLVTPSSARKGSTGGRRHAGPVTIRAVAARRSRQPASRR